MINISQKNIYKSDICTINRCLKDYNFIYQKKINPKKIFNKQMKFLISDNIRVGLKFRNYYFISPFAIFKKNYLNYKEIQKFLKKTIKVDSKNFYLQFDKSKFLYRNLKIRLLNKKIKNNKILVLGPNKRNLEIIKNLKKKDFSVVNINSKIDLKFIKKNKIDFVISSGYPFKITKDIVRFLDKKIINLHATFLPWGKGIGTTLFSIILRQPTGISIHIIDKDFDTGAIIIRKSVKFANKDTTRTFYSKLLKGLENLFLQNMNLLLNNKVSFYDQNKFNVKVPYLSRDNFEKIVELLPNGYDTKMLDLIKLSNIFFNNLNFINNLKK